MEIDLQEALKDSLAYRRREMPKPPFAPPGIYVDECLNDPRVELAIKSLSEAGLAAGGGPLWKEKRIRPDGEPFFVWGGYKRDRALEGWRGAPAKYFSWSDDRVLFSLIGQFLGSDHLVLLTENRRQNTAGLLVLLRENVKPVLDTEHDGRFRLDVLMKKGKTSLDQYCHQIASKLTGSPMEGGYYEAFL
jgi:hypothetical protein